MIGEVQYQYQTWIIAQMSLQLTLSKPSDQPDSPLWIEELWLNAVLFNQPMSHYTTPKPLDGLQIEQVPALEMEYNLKFNDLYYCYNLTICIIVKVYWLMSD